MYSLADIGISKTALHKELKEVRKAFGYSKPGLSFEYGIRPTNNLDAWDGQLWMIADLYEMIYDKNELGLSIHIYKAQTPSTQDHPEMIDVIFIDNIPDLFNKNWYIESNPENLSGGGILVHKKLVFSDKIEQDVE